MYISKMLSFLVVFLIVLNSVKCVNIGNTLYLWGCNTNFQLGSTSPNGNCADSAYCVPYPRLWDFHNDIILSSTSFFHDISMLGRLSSCLIQHGQSGNSIIYTWGIGDIYASKIGPTYHNPHVKVNISHAIITRMEGGAGDILHEFMYYYIESLQELWGFGDNNEGFMNDPSIVGGTYVPTLVLENVFDFAITNRGGIVIDDVTRKSFKTIGDNSYGIHGYSGGPTQYNFIPFNMSAFNMSNGYIKSLYLDKRSKIIVFNDDYTTYGWGALKGFFEFNTVASTLYKPHLLNWNHVESHMNRSFVICDIRCALWSCVMLVKHHKYHYHEVLSWSVFPQEYYIGRSIDFNYVPKMIYKNNIDTDIIAISKNGISVFLLGENGKLYGFGRNNRLIFGSQFPIDSDVNFPIPLFKNMTNITSIFRKDISETNNLSMFVLQSSVTCNNLYPNRPEGCNNRGECIDNDKCSCNKNYYGNLCQFEKSCYGFYATDELVCNSLNGICINNDECLCNEQYKGDNCEIANCFNIWGDNHNEVCSNHGKCINENECICNENYYGIKCEEKIHSPRFSTRDLNIIIITYEIHISLIPYELSYTKFNCDIIIEDAVQIGNDLLCYFSYKNETSEYLYITNILPNENRVRINDSIVINVFTSDNKAHTYLHNYVHSFVDFLIDFWFIFVIIFIIILLLLVLLIVIVLIPIVTLQRKKLSKLNGIEDLDVVLEEIKIDQRKQSNDEYAKLKLNKDFVIIDYSEITLEKEIGSGGSCANVFVGSWSGKKVAIKITSFEDLKMNEDHIKTFEKEICIAISLKHPFILTSYGAILKKPRIGIVMEFCENGDLKNFLLRYQKKNKKNYGLKNKIRMLKEIIIGMKYLHSKNIIHRDLKPGNILISNVISIQICDFGLSRLLENHTKTITRQLGTSYYMSPQNILGLPYTNKTDIFSFGILAYQIFSEEFRYPFGKEETKVGIEFKIANNPYFRPNINNLINVPNHIKNMIKSCWTHKEINRPSFMTLLKVIEKNKKKNKKAIVVYFVLKNQSQIEAEDFLLTKFTLKNLKKIALKKFPYAKRLEMSILDPDINDVNDNSDKKKKIIESDIHVQNIKQNAIVEVNVLEEDQKVMNSQLEDLREKIMMLEDGQKKLIIENMKLKDENEVLQSKLMDKI